MSENPQVVWITGGGTGLGRAMALEFSRKGYFVAVSGRRQDPLDEVVAAMTGPGLAVTCDVMQESTVQAALKTVLDERGRLDIAVANAGYAVGGKIADISEAEWTRQMGVNVVGAATTVRLALPELQKTKGRIVLIASVASMLYSPRTGAYNASKAAVRAMGLTLALELKGSGVTCTTIHPGFVESEISRVDNSGVYHADWEDRRPKALMWPADKAGRVMVRAIEKRRVEYVFTGHGKIGGWLGRHMPWLVYFLLSRKWIKL